MLSSFVCPRSSCTAQELSLTQSAVSREIKKLEDQLGQPLFDRINRGLRLTPAGRALHRAVGEALNLIDEATDRVGATAASETLTVTTSAPLASLWLVPRIAGFVRLHPAVDVRCVAADQWLDLQRERLDIALRWAPELARHVLLDLETVTASGPWSDWAPWLQEKGLANLRAAGALRFSHYDQVVRAAIDGSGVALGRMPHNARHLTDGLLVAPLAREGILRWGSYFVLMSPRSAERPIVKAFVAWLRAQVRIDAG